MEKDEGKRIGLKMMQSVKAKKAVEGWRRKPAPYPIDQEKRDRG
ncbi:MAG: hypothetical protein WBA93_33295 [Microcoleaceae cyanobacterium]